MENRIVGVKKVAYTNKQGKDVSGFVVYYQVEFDPTESDVNLEGIECGSVWLKPAVYSQMLSHYSTDSLIGLTGQFTYDQWKNVAGFMKF